MNSDDKLPAEYVYTDLKLKILTGKYKPGDKLPSIRNLIKIYEVSTMTVQKSLKYLEDDELIYTQKNIAKYIITDTQKIEDSKSNYISNEVSVFLNSLSSVGINSYDEVCGIIKRYIGKTAL